MKNRCSCAQHTDGSVTTFLCPMHADSDPCLTMAQVTGRRRKGTIRRGVCTACGHGGPVCMMPAEIRGVRMGGHSHDIVEVWHGMSTPAVGCGFHATYYAPELFEAHAAEMVQS